MTILDLILGTLCGFRLTQLITWDKILARPVRWFASLHPKLDELLTCAHCVGFWCGMATAALLLFGQHWWPLRLAVWGLGLAGGVSIVQHATCWLSPTRMEYDTPVFTDTVVNL